MRRDLIIISREILQDDRLSWAARGVAAFLLSDGDPSLTDGCAEFDELIEAGYMDFDESGTATLRDTKRGAASESASIQPMRADPIPTTVPIRRSIRRSKSKRILERDFYRCRYCGSHIDLTIDHVIPIIQGGDSSDNNLVACCRRCNSRKSGRTPEQAGMVLLGETPL